MTAVALIDAANNRASRALAEKAAAKRRADELEAELSVLKAKPAPLAVESVPAPDHALTYRRNGKKYVIPIGLLLAALPVATTGVQRVLGYERQLKDLTQLVSRYEEREAAQTSRIAELEKGQHSLRVTVAKMSGYIGASLGVAGIEVTESEPGAIAIDLELARGAVKPKPRFKVNTPVPAPSPRK